MEVILREHVDNLGRRGEVVKVADGYARNYLLPRKLALLVTEGNKKQIEREREKLEAKEAEEKKVAEAMSARMASLELEISRRVGETEALYGSVTTSDIAEALAKKGFDVDRRKVVLQEPIKKLGQFDVPVRLQRDHLPREREARHHAAREGRHGPDRPGADLVATAEGAEGVLDVLRVRSEVVGERIPLAGGGVVLDGAGDDLAGGGGALVDEDDDGDVG